MKVAGWNLRGFGRSGRKTQLKDFIKKEALDIIFFTRNYAPGFHGPGTQRLGESRTFPLALATGSGPLGWHVDGGER
jgi:hypothetical protein